MRADIGAMFLVIAVTLGACSGRQAAGQNNVFKPDVDALKKAQSVQNTIQQGAQREREIIDQSSGASSPSSPAAAPGS